MKYLIGVTPAGAASFLSYEWGGHASEKLITLNSSFLEMVSHGECILADHGILIEEELAASTWSSFKNPSFHTRKKNN